MINAISKMTKAMINTGEKIKKLIIRNKLAKTTPAINPGIKPITGGGGIGGIGGTGGCGGIGGIGGKGGSGGKG
ncbi:MAG: hypothetical protein NC238_05815 [Dehalobacter sp.]|nr:hypothetical protein [Dehalobacter sp.]